ncbi:signal transduction histidine kinase [Actinocrispum wychmicini]|uniref:histidine kinase n=2 Tax=Actinocrispum wychmicini TaxID=1213861 RepID=A0A4R2JP31_9PSEU|nr:signal transduction histidine kinase [Actinocrispum wychmicini]
MADLALVLALLATQWPPPHDFLELHLRMRWLAVAIAVVGIGCLTMRRRYPRAVFCAVVLAHGCLVLLLDDPRWMGTGYAAFVALYGVAYRSSLPAAIVAGVVTAVISEGNYHAIMPDASGLIPSVCLVVIVIVVLGRTRRTRARDAARLDQMVHLLDQTRSRVVSEVVAVERHRIASELHDVVAHSLAIVVVRAGAARVLLPDNPTEATAALTAIESVTGTALSEMDGLLVVPGGTPSPGIHHLEELVGMLRATGMTVDLQRHGPPYPLPEAGDHVAFRVVREALTNVLKHARHGTAEVTLRYLPGGLQIDVHNLPPSDPRPPSLPPSGHGLAGLRTRLESLGGSLRAGPVDDGFRVTAVLPRSTRQGAVW